MNRPACAPGFTYHKWREPKPLPRTASGALDYEARTCTRCGARGVVNHHGIVEAERINP